MLLHVYDIEDKVIGAISSTFDSLLLPTSEIRLAENSYFF